MSVNMYLWLFDVMCVFVWRTVTISVGVCLYLNNYLHVMSVCVCNCWPVC